MRRVRFSDVVKRVNVFVDQHNTDLLYYVGGEHMDSRELKVSGKGLINGSTIGYKFHFGFQPGHILFGSRNPHLRKCSMVDFSGICSDSTYVVETRDSNVLDQRYLLIEMQSNRFWDWAEENKSGSVNYLINYCTLDEYEFDLPPIERQRELANLLWAANDLKESYKKAIIATDEMLKAKFREMFGNTKDSKGNIVIGTVCIGEITELVTKGTTPTSIGFQFEDEGVNFLKAENITDDGRFVRETMMHISDGCNDKLRRSQLRAGDYLFSIAGVIGRTAIVDESILPCNTNQAIAIIRLKNLPELDRAFFGALLRSEFVLKQCELQQKQTAQANISLEDVRNIAVPLPPLSLQREFVAIAERADTAKSALKQSIADIEQVMKGLING